MRRGRGQSRQQQVQDEYSMPSVLRAAGALAPLPRTTARRGRASARRPLAPAGLAPASPPPVPHPAPAPASASIPLPAYVPQTAIVNITEPSASATAVADEDTSQHCICRATDAVGGLVQCDRCCWWFHPVCLGLTMAEVALISPFYCVGCLELNGLLPTTSPS